MNKKKTTVKGFTLIELIIVLAIFSVIMTLVMSFIDPVSKLMTKTSVRERTAAYVDNIGEYVSKSIRYAQNISVYEHGLTGSEDEVVRDFVDTYYNRAISEDGSNLEGKVHVLKLINTADGSLEAGRIYESVYTFKAGSGTQVKVYFNNETNQYVPDSEFNGMDDATKDAYIEEKGYDSKYKTSYDDEGKHSKVTIQSENVSVINDEHFKDYSYYYQLGMYTFDPIPDSSDDKAKYFYSRLKKMTDSAGAVVSDSVNEEQFVMNVVSYMRDKKDGLDSIVDYTYEDEDGNEVTVPSFRSPAAMSSVGMTFKNVRLQKEANSVKYYRKAMIAVEGQTDSNGNQLYEESVDENGDNIIEAVFSDEVPASFNRITDGTSDNIYMIFTVPSEIKDTEWNEGSPATPSGGGSMLI